MRKSLWDLDETLPDGFVLDSAATTAERAMTRYKALPKEYIKSAYVKSVYVRYKSGQRGVRWGVLVKETK